MNILSLAYVFVAEDELRGCTKRVGSIFKILSYIEFP
jgi:hypothetical protein